MSSSMAPDPGPFALDRARTLGPLIADAARIWWSRPALFLLVAFVIAVPFDVVVLGFLGGGFNDPEGWASDGAQLADQVVYGTVITGLVTAAHARAVVALARGESVTLGRALRLAFTRFWPVLGACVLYGVLTTLGLIFLLIPGLFIAIAAVFAAPAAALTKSSPASAIAESLRLVHVVGWWRTAGYWLVPFALGLAAMLGVIVGLEAIRMAAGEPDWFGIPAVLAEAFTAAALLSWTALIGTLMFFSWRARDGDPYGGQRQGDDPRDAGPDLISADGGLEPVGPA